MRTSIAILSFLFLTTCSNDDSINNCNFLLNVAIDRTINLSLPENNVLMFTNNVVYVPNEGNLGIYVINTGTGFRAFDAADPNHVPDTCSFMELNGLEVTCGCADENKYLLATGTSLGTQLPCGLQEYRATRSGNVITVSN
ncbi:hypothetical protein [Sediminibacter sp. Hel_I_10]|uniref:hypothetical protein n=1 Tax=Sediminibacter sp. Hel_I_10 TaxID=1392490 RepID=UPI00047A099F|nr:hypothetical protein [Sediminibacter sp. Hel_I_10]